jgi:outer membrane immunogenic protein
VKKFIAVATAIAALGFVSSASAADMPAKAPVYKAAPVAMYNWTGFYIGGHAGFGSASSSANWDPLPSPAVFGANPNAYQLHGTGFLGGVQAGYNWQMAPMWVLGVEGDWSWTRLNDSASLPVNFFGGAPAPPARADVSRNVKWLASVRGRAGYLVAPTVLLYGTGGFAFGQVGYHGFYQNNTPTQWLPADFNKTETGYVVGAGVEWAVMANWLLRAEYLYYNLKGESVSGFNPTAGFFPIQFSWGRTTINTGRVALSYKF